MDILGCGVLQGFGGNYFSVVVLAPLPEVVIIVACSVSNELTEVTWRAVQARGSGPPQSTLRIITSINKENN